MDDEIRLALLDFGTREWFREIEDGFPCLKAMSSSVAPAANALRWIVDFPASERPRAGAALVRRFWGGPLGEGQKHLTDEERCYVDNFMASHAGTPTWSMMVPPADGDVKAARSEIRRALKVRLAESRYARGMVWSKVEGGEIQAAIPGKRLTIETWIDTGGRFNALSYHHEIVVPNGRKVARFISILSWLGISSQTTWAVVWKRDMSTVADLVLQLHDHFIREFAEPLGFEMSE